MVLDGPVEYQPPEQKPYVSLIAKKRSLDAPAKILLAGAEHLRNLQSESNCGTASSAKSDFHLELLKLRQNWRLKKVSNTILGDLSYRGSGSTYKQCSGVFEVTKADDDIKEGSEQASGENENCLKMTVEM
jgi:mediator of RNA polymerase II transcription subunit 17